MRSKKVTLNVLIVVRIDKTEKETCLRVFLKLFIDFKYKELIDKKKFCKKLEINKMALDWEKLFYTYFIVDIDF